MTSTNPIVLRPYQVEAVEAVYQHLRTRDDNPCVVIPTAGGKTPVMAKICRDVVAQWGGRVLILAHVKELLEQMVDKLNTMAPDLRDRTGIHSAGLGCRDCTQPIIVAGIQSVFRKAEKLGHFDMILVDEAHTIPPDGEGMYRTYLEGAKKINPKVRIVGLTATPFRMKTGLICSPQNLLNKICYEISVKELIVQGYLCNLISKGTKHPVDTSNLHVRAGEFIPEEVEKVMNTDYRVLSACAEITTLACNRNSVLIFASTINHAKSVYNVLSSMSTSTAVVFGNTPSEERARIISQFKAGELKYLINVGVLTHGFDAPNIDCVVLLRPTNSPGLYYQCCGRGFRMHPGKTDCLILDYGGNVIRHGPVDALQVPGAKKWGSDDAAEKGPRAKQCPTCNALVAPGYANCPQCGAAFPPPDRRKHSATASTASVLSGATTFTTVPVHGVAYYVHRKRGAPPGHPRSMRVDYHVGLNQTKSEWICFEHTGYPREKAEQWWRKRSRLPVPDTVEDAINLADRGALAPTISIKLKHVAGEKYDQIVGYELGEIPLTIEEEADIPF